jgi:hypothetical protein
VRGWNDRAPSSASSNAAMATAAITRLRMGMRAEGVTGRVPRAREG